MGSLDQTIKDLLAGAPELIHTPQATTGIAVGAMQTGAQVDARALGRATALAQMIQGWQEVHQEARGLDGPSGV